MPTHMSPNTGIILLRFLLALGVSRFARWRLRNGYAVLQVMYGLVVHVVLLFGCRFADFDNIILVPPAEHNICDLWLWLVEVLLRTPRYLQQMSGLVGAEAIGGRAYVVNVRIGVTRSE